MAGSEIPWIEGVANRGKELIFPGRHVQQHEWKPEWNREFRKHYDYISDYECPFPYSKERHEPILSQTKKENLWAAKQQRDPILIDSLVHCTPFLNVKGIISDKGFKGSEKKINNTQKAYLSWWSPYFSEDVRENLQNQMQTFFSQLADDKINNINKITEQFGKSDAFRIDPYRGQGHECDYYFKYSIDELLKSYQDHIGDEKMEFGILGTFAYPVKVEYNVLVCSESARKDEFAEYPLVPQENNVVTRDKEGKFWWYPKATGTVIKRFHPYQTDPKYRRYDRVSFAFHVREGEIFETDCVKDKGKKIPRAYFTRAYSRRFIYS
ncbi:uncharacterized protein LOC124436957 [Xenia sp. Carnegie-2017]|uniref:uncharacterized protein LOC124436957 n=1 Tax=Xenia sp. Carnegie-2017 TaxID=2897299 RepID=UPI001F033552|nr:uncharacterized protein LOC124436957 [Xenia sp. Carnegie-2017]